MQRWNKERGNRKKEKIICKSKIKWDQVILIFASNNETEIQSVQKITVAEASWIILCEPFLSPKLLEVSPVGNFHEHFIEPAKQETCNSSNICLYSDTVIMQAQKAPCRQINCSYLGECPNINSALLHLWHFLKMLWSSQLHGNFSFQLYFFFKFLPYKLLPGRPKFENKRNRSLTN